MDLWPVVPCAGRSEALVVSAGVAIHTARCCSILLASSSLSNQSMMTYWLARGSLIEIAPLGAGGSFDFFFFFAGSSKAGSFPRGGCRYLGGFSTMSSDEDDELLSDGRTVGA